MAIIGGRIYMQKNEIKYGICNKYRKSMQQINIKKE